MKSNPRFCLLLLASIALLAPVFGAVGKSDLAPPENSPCERGRGGPAGSDSDARAGLRCVKDALQSGWLRPP